MLLYFEAFNMARFMERIIYMCKHTDFATKIMLFTLNNINPIELSKKLTTLSRRYFSKLKN